MKNRTRQRTEWNGNGVQRLGKQAFWIETLFFLFISLNFPSFLVIIAADGEHLAFLSSGTMQIGECQCQWGREFSGWEREIEAFLDNDKHGTHSFFCIWFSTGFFFPILCSNFVIIIFFSDNPLEVCALLEQLIMGLHEMIYITALRKVSLRV